MSLGLEKVTAEDFELPSFSLHGKKALITGGSRGIGKATALTLAGLGADVALTYYTGCKFAGDVRDQIRDMGRKANCYAHDIGDPDTLDELRSQVLNDLGPIDI